MCSQSPNEEGLGMIFERHHRRLVLSLLASTAIPNFSLALEPSGSAVSVSASAEASGPGGTRILNAPGDVFQGDVIVTDPRGQAQIQFVDDTRFVVGPNSRVVIDEFVFNSDGTAQDVALNTLKGTFRFISGKSPHEVYSIHTPTMTIGVRGTIVNIRVLGSGVSYANWGEGSGIACVVPEGSPNQLRTECRDTETGDTVGAAPGGGFANFRPGELNTVLTTIANGLGPGVGTGFGPPPPPPPTGDKPGDHHSSSPY
jgi:hypothetical protein